MIIKLFRSTTKIANTSHMSYIGEFATQGNAAMVAQALADKLQQTHIIELEEPGKVVQHIFVRPEPANKPVLGQQVISEVRKPAKNLENTIPSDQRLKFCGATKRTGKRTWRGEKEAVRRAYLACMKKGLMVSTKPNGKDGLMSINWLLIIAPGRYTPIAARSRRNAEILTY